MFEKWKENRRVKHEVRQKERREEEELRVKIRKTLHDNKVVEYVTDCPFCKKENIMYIDEHWNYADPYCCTMEGYCKLVKSRFCDHADKYVAGNKIKKITFICSHSSDTEYETKDLKLKLYDGTLIDYSALPAGFD